MPAPLITNALIIAALMLAAWLLSLPLRDVSIVDILWGAGFVVVAWASMLQADAIGAGRIGPWLILGLTTLWGLRLSAYLAWRNHGRPEDRRYAAMRDNWGRAFPAVSLITVFGLQGLVMWIVSLPVQLGIAASAAPQAGLIVPGVLLWSVGMIFETVGDWQLARFRAEPANAGKVFDGGLWRYTRHPNYFGDFCVWWGLFLAGVACGAPWWTIVGPIVMSVLLVAVSGVTLLEHDLQQRKPEYANYMRRTNSFFPGPPRQSVLGEG